MEDNEIKKPADYVVDAEELDPSTKRLANTWLFGYKDKMTFEEFLYQVEIGIIRFDQYAVRNPVQPFAS